MSTHPDQAGMSGNNPIQHNQPTELPASVPVELAGDDGYRPPHPLQSNPVGVIYPQENAPAGQRQQYIPSPMSPVQEQSGNNDGLFPPPPPGPPPSSSTSHGQEQQQYYPPPPSGPPPVFSDDGHQQSFPPPPPGPPPKQTYGHGQAAEQPPPDFPPPPSYSEEFGEGPEFVDEKRPVPGPPHLPPRPGSSSGSTQFPPPPKSPTQAHTHAPNPAAAAATASSSTPSTSKHGGFGQKLYQWGLKAGGPINKLTNKLGSEAFWPTTMDKECDKAARILKSFCKDGYYTTNNNSPVKPDSQSKTSSSSHGPTTEPKTLVKIPRSAIANAKGLAIFTTLRTGLHVSGAAGSGVVVARLENGDWSPPAGFLVHTLGAGLLVGLDIYDCVCVLRTQAAVDAFMDMGKGRPRISLGGELAVAAGPVGVGGVVEGVFGGRSGKSEKAESGKTVGGGESLQPGGAGGDGAMARPKSSSGGAPGCENKPVWSYMKSRGFYGGVQVDGTVIVPRQDANAAFYGEEGITVDSILKGRVNSSPTPAKTKTGGGGDLVMWPEGGRQLMEVLRAAEGKTADGGVIKGLEGPTPGDLAKDETGAGAGAGADAGAGGMAHGSTEKPSGERGARYM